MAGLLILAENILILFQYGTFCRQLKITFFNVVYGMNLDEGKISKFYPSRISVYAFVLIITEIFYMIINLIEWIKMRKSSRRNEITFIFFK